MKVFTILLTSLLFISNLSAQEGYPKPSAKNILFYIQHNRGKNTIIYQANFNKQGSLDHEHPIRMSRQLFDQRGEIKPLTTIQRKFAYGVETNQIDPNYFEVKLVAYPRQVLYLKVDKQHPYIETNIGGKSIILERLFIQQREGTSGLSTKVDAIIFHGVDKNGKAVQQVLRPD